MHSFLAEAVQRLALSAVEGTLRAAFSAALRPRVPPPAPVSPTDEAVLVVDSFFRAIAARDVGALTEICDAVWEVQPGTAELIQELLDASPPVSWAVDAVLVPDDWRIGFPLAWVLTELAVTFGTRETGFETIPGVVRVTAQPEGWRIDYLEWHELQQPEPGPEPDTGISWFDAASPLFEEFALQPPPGPVVVVCARCAQKLCVPGDRGRLRVTCPRCSNVQWYVPGTP
jgi:hypothetical protein